MNKFLSVIFRTISIFIAVPSVLALSQVLMICYMLIVGDVRPGDRMMYDGVAPSYRGAAILAFVLLVLLVLAFFISKMADKLSHKLK